MFEKSDDNLFSLAIVVKLYSSFIILLSKLTLYNGFKVNTAFWISQQDPWDNSERNVLCLELKSDPLLIMLFHVPKIRTVHQA